jgi:hypothetical protein
VVGASDEDEVMKPKANVIGWIGAIVIGCVCLGGCTSGPPKPRTYEGKYVPVNGSEQCGLIVPCRVGRTECERRKLTCKT